MKDGKVREIRVKVLSGWGWARLNSWMGMFRVWRGDAQWWKIEFCVLHQGGRRLPKYRDLVLSVLGLNVTRQLKLGHRNDPWMV